MIEATFNAIAPTPIIAEFEAIVPREKALEVKNKNITIEQNGTYTVKADAGTTMTEVGIGVDVKPNNQVKRVSITSNGEHTISVDSNFDGMSEVKVVNSVYEGFDLKEFGVEGDLANTVNGGIMQALVENRELMEWGKINANWSNKMCSVFFVDIPMTHVTNLYYAFFGNRHLSYMYDFNFPNCTDLRNTYSFSIPPSITHINAEKVNSFQSCFQYANLVNCKGDISINIGNMSTTNSTVNLNAMFQSAENINLSRLEIIGDRARDLSNFLFVSKGNIDEIIFSNTENVTTLKDFLTNGVYTNKVVFGSVEKCTNFYYFLGNRSPSTLHFTHWKTTNIPLTQASTLLPESINYIIEHALGEEDGATQRTLTLHATAKSNWQKNAEYEKYSAMAYDKLITIA